MPHGCLLSNKFASINFKIMNKEKWKNVLCHNYTNIGRCVHMKCSVFLDRVEGFVCIHDAVECLYVVDLCSHDDQHHRKTFT
jgi:hypothetical protein